MGCSGYQPSDRAVLAGHSEITGCHLEPMLDPVPASQRSITPTLIKCPPFFHGFLFTSCFQDSELIGLLSLGMAASHLCDPGLFSTHIHRSGGSKNEK